jgi:uncharacterized protein
MSDMPPSPPASSANDEKGIAALTHASGILFGFIVPLVVWLLKKDQSAYLGDNAKEALNFQITILIGYCVSWVLMFLLIGFLVFPLLMLANLIFCILAAVKTNNGETYRYPFALRLIK